MNTQESPIISVKNLTKLFDTADESLTILNDISFDVIKGQKIAIVGPSGSGKSTLLSLLAGLDSPTSGSVFVDGVDITKSLSKDLSIYRNNIASIIFQSFELIAPFTVQENVMAPLDIRGEEKSKAKTAVAAAIESAKLTHRSEAYPSTLSGGEKQRVAIARALAADTPIIFADEPTGSLDRATGNIVLDLLIDEVNKRGKTLVIITHDIKIAEKMDRIIEVKDGKIYEEK